MLTVAKLLMRGAALAIALLVLWATHIIRPDVNTLEAGAVFCVLWMCLTFAAVLLASSWVVGRAGQGFKFGKDTPPPSNAEVEALRKKLSAECSVDGCRESRMVGIPYCGNHRERYRVGGGQ